MSIIPIPRSSLQQEQLPLPLLPLSSLPKFELVPYGKSMSASKLLITSVFLESQKKSIWNPATWWELVLGPSKEELDRRITLTIFEEALNDHEYRDIEENDTGEKKVLAIIEKVFGLLSVDPAGEPFHNLHDEQIFNVLETFYEYSQSFDKLARGSRGCLSKHIIHFLPTASASPLSINFIALSILNETIKTLFPTIPELLEKSLVKAYKDTLVRTNSDFIRQKSSEGLMILNVNPMSTRIAARCEIITEYVKESSTCRIIGFIISIGGILFSVQNGFKGIEGMIK